MWGVLSIPLRLCWAVHPVELTEINRTQDFGYASSQLTSTGNATTSLSALSRGAHPSTPHAFVPGTGDVPTQSEGGKWQRPGIVHQLRPRVSAKAHQWLPAKPEAMGEAWTHLPSQASEGTNLLIPWFWTSGLQNCEIRTLSHPVCGMLLQQP